MSSATSGSSLSGVLTVARVWLERNGAWLGALATLLALGGIIWGVGKWLFAAPDVAVTLKNYPVAFPSVIAGDFSKSFNRATLLGLAQADSTFRPLVALDDFLRDTENFVTVTVANNSDRTIQNVDIRIKGLHRLTGYSIGGDLLASVEEKSIRDSTRFDPGNGILTIGNITRIPPKRTLNVFVWGDGALIDLLGSEPVTVVYDGGTGKLIQVAEIRGKDAFVYENAALLFLIILAANAGFLALKYAPPEGTKTVSRSADKTPET